MKKKRRFKLKNETIVEAMEDFDGSDYPQKYKVAMSTDERIQPNSVITLAQQPPHMPSGGLYGDGFDMVKEV